jgi:hypothetical protein
MQRVHIACKQQAARFQQRFKEVDACSGLTQ